jgi:ribonuclease HI
MTAERSTVENLPCIDIWTDGSCDNMTNVGGYAAVLRCSPHEKSIGGPLENTTSQRCEMTAAIEALKTLKKRSSVVIYTDSKYLMDGATKWAPSWLARGKLHIKANCDLWSELLCLMEDHEVHFEKVKAHSGESTNELVDKLAKQARRREDSLQSSETEDGGEVLHLSREARRSKPRVAESISWPVESTENYLRFGREVARLYPFVQHNREEVAKVMTPLGPGTIKQAFSDGVKVALDNPVRWLYSKSGKPSPAMEEFQVGEIWPLTSMGNEIGPSSDGRGLPGLRGDREDIEQAGAYRDSDKVVPDKGRPEDGGTSTGEEAEVAGECEASQSDAQLSLL